MARHRDAPSSQRIGWAGLVLLACLLLILALAWRGWRSGLLTAWPADVSWRAPAAPDLPRLPRAPMPDPQPAPLPRPGPRTAG